MQVARVVVEGMCQGSATQGSATLTHIHLHLGIELLQGDITFTYRKSTIR